MRRPCTLAGRPLGCILERDSGAVNPEARRRAGSPMSRGERMAKPTEWDTHAAGFCFCALLAYLEGTMRHTFSRFLLGSSLFALSIGFAVMLIPGAEAQQYP